MRHRFIHGDWALNAQQQAGVRMGRVMLATSSGTPLFVRPARSCSTAGICGLNFATHSRPISRGRVRTRPPAPQAWAAPVLPPYVCQAQRHHRQEAPSTPFAPATMPRRGVVPLGGALRALSLLALCIVGPGGLPLQASAQPPTATVQSLQSPQQYATPSYSSVALLSGVSASCEESGVLEGGEWSLLGQGASGVTYRVTTPRGGDYVVKKAGNAAQDQSLARELRALRVLEGVGAVKEGWVKAGLGTCGPLLVMTPFFDGQQVDTLDMVPAGAARDGAVASLASLLHTMVVKARLVSSDVQVLVEEGSSGGGVALHLIDLTEAQFLDESPLDGEGEGSEQRRVLAVSAFVSEVLTLLPPQDEHAQTVFAQALAVEHRTQGDESREWAMLCRLMPQLLPLADTTALQPFTTPSL